MKSEHFSPPEGSGTVRPRQLHWFSRWRPTTKWVEYLLECTYSLCSPYNSSFQTYVVPCTDKGTSYSLQMGIRCWVLSGIESLFSILSSESIFLAEILLSTHHAQQQVVHISFREPQEHCCYCPQSRFQCLDQCRRRYIFLKLSMTVGSFTLLRWASSTSQLQARCRAAPFQLQEASQGS